MTISVGTKFAICHHFKKSKQVCSDCLEELTLFYQEKLKANDSKVVDIGNHKHRWTIGDMPEGKVEFCFDCYERREQ